MNLFLGVFLVFVSCSIWSSDLSAVDWVEKFKKQSDIYRTSIPDNIMEDLKKKYPQFRPMKIGDEYLTAGDFNCDGQLDFAIVGLDDNDHILTKILLEKETSIDMDLAKFELDKYISDRPATVLVGLSTSKKSFNWVKLPGSDTDNAGISAGCQNATNKKQLEELEKSKCQFLYIGCCEKDGKYQIWEKDSTKVKVIEGC